MRGGHLNLHQRIVVVIGLGAAFVVLGSWVTTRVGRTGWVSYAPLTATGNSPGGLHPWARLLVWLVLIVVWALGSVVMLRTPPPSDDGEVR